MSALAPLGLLVAIAQGIAAAEDAVEQGPKPLYLHWFKPAYTVGDGTPARHLASVRVHPNSKFDVAFAEPGFEARTVSIRGNIRIEDGRHVGSVDTSWRSGERFGGRYELDKPRSGDLTWFSGAYWSTMVVLTHQKSPREFLATPLANDVEDVTDEGARSSRPKRQPDLVADIRVDGVTWWMSRGAESTEIGKAWYVVRARILDVVAGGAAKKGDVVQVILLADAQSDVLGFHNERRRASAISEAMVKTRNSVVKLRVRLTSDPGRGADGEPPTFVPFDGVETSLRGRSAKRPAAESSPENTEGSATSTGVPVDSSVILKLDGDAEAGAELFRSAAVTCIQCHRVDGNGMRFGPDLDRIGTKLDRGRMLESILAPSKQISRKWRTLLVVRKSGEVHSGFLVDRTADRLVLWENPEKPNRTIAIPLEDVEEMAESKVSAMPVPPLDKLTERQLADLVAYLTSLK